MGTISIILWNKWPRPFNSCRRRLGGRIGRKKSSLCAISSKCTSIPWDVRCFEFFKSSYNTNSCYQTVHKFEFHRQSLLKGKISTYSFNSLLPNLSVIGLTPSGKNIAVSTVNLCRTSVPHDADKRNAKLWIRTPQKGVRDLKISPLKIKICATYEFHFNWENL